MFTLIAAAGWAVAVGWMLFRAANQLASYETLEEGAAPASTSDTVSVIIPARNEAETIGRCLSGVLTQDYPRERVEVIVVNDQSSDATGEVARRFTSASTRVRVVKAGPLPEGWTGKSHACQQGASLAGSQWLCFLDADTVPESELLSEAIAICQRRGLDMLSLEPRQTLGSFSERLFVPCAMLGMALVQDLRQINDPASPRAAANGQFLLFRRTAYNAVGGHAAVASEIGEDTALAHCIKQSGRHFALLGGERLIRVRMYRSFRSLWRGFSKNAVLSMPGRSHALLLVACGGAIAWISVFLPVATVWQWAVEPSVLALAAMLLACTASAALLATHIAAARHFHVPFWYGLLFPLGYLLGAAILLNSVIWFVHDRVGWKGRVYRPAKISGHGQ